MNAPGALVVGGSGVIGSATAVLLAERGHHVGVTFRTTPVDWDPAWPLDLRDPEACVEVVDYAVDALGGLRTLVYASGPFTQPRHLSKVDPALMDEQLNADTAAFFNIVHATLPTLRETAGSIVAVTHAATSRHPVRDGLAVASKAAIEALVRGIAVEEGRYGVRANCVGPGMLTDGSAARLIDSGDLDEHALEVTLDRIPLRRFGSAVDVAEAVCFLASDRARFITGQKLDVDGGYTA